MLMLVMKDWKTVAVPFSKILPIVQSDMMK